MIMIQNIIKGIIKMDRRSFIKNTLITAAAVAGTSVLGRTAKSILLQENKKMKILVLTGSPRKNGNSNTLADYFIKGASEAGHQVVRFDAAFKNVHPCTGCNACGMNGPCVFKDDFEFVRQHLVDADVVVFATPMYYFGISAQLKTVIDRFYALNGQIHRPKKAALLMTYANTAASEAEPIKSHYKVLLNYLGWTDAGQIIASGVWPVGAVNQTEYPQQAYELGKHIS